MTAASARAAATLLRAASVACRDAALLAGKGRLSPASAIVAEAARWVVQAVAVSEAGWPSAAGLDDIPSENPLRDRLAALIAACPPPPAPVRPNGLPGTEPDAGQIGRSLDQLRAAVARTAQEFAVDLDGEGPAGRDGPLRRAPSPPIRQAASAPRQIVVRRPPERAAAAPRPVPPSVPIPAPARGGSVSSSPFWALMGSWGVDDRTALALLGHEGGLTKKGTRPRFKLEGAEAERVAFLREIDTSLRSLGLDPREWLATPAAAAPFGGQAPLGFLAAGGAARDVNRFILQQGLRLSMRPISRV